CRCCRRTSRTCGGGGAGAPRAGNAEAGATPRGRPARRPRRGSLAGGRPNTRRASPYPPPKGGRPPPGAAGSTPGATTHSPCPGPGFGSGKLAGLHTLSQGFRVQLSDEPLPMPTQLEKEPPKEIQDQFMHSSGRFPADAPEVQDLLKSVAPPSTSDPLGQMRGL